MWKKVRRYGRRLELFFILPVWCAAASVHPKREEVEDGNQSWAPKFITQLYTIFRGKYARRNLSHSWEGKEKLIKQCSAKRAHSISRTLQIKHTMTLGLITQAQYGGKSWLFRIWSLKSPKEMGFLRPCHKKHKYTFANRYKSNHKLYFTEILLFKTYLKSCINEFIKRHVSIFIAELW